MSNNDFQERLERIRANAPHRTSVANGRAVRQGPNYGRVLVGGFLMAVGVQALKLTNRNYEAIRDSGGIGLAAVGGLVGAAVLVLGLVVMARAFPRGCARASAPSPSDTVQPLQQTSRLARVLFSLLGFLLGTVASFYMFVSSAAHIAGTERSQTVANGALLIALGLALLALLIGFAGLFVSRYPLRRVPVFFVLGGMLLMAAFRAFRIHPVDWPQFMALLQ